MNIGALHLIRRFLGVRGDDVLAAFAAFMALPGSVFTDVALRFVEIIDSTGLKALAAERRQRLALQIDPAALDIADDVIDALEDCPEMEERAGVKARNLAVGLGQIDQIDGLRWLFARAQGQVADARLLLQAWLFEAERALCLQVFKEMTTAQGQDLWQLLGDAGPALDFIEEELKERQADLRKQEKKTARLQEQLDQINGEIELLKAMQQVRAQQPRAQAAALDENTLRAAARRFAERMAKG